jgi:arylsulfatase A-like enzyme
MSKPKFLPNIIILVLDTVRSDHLSCYDYHRPTSPSLDRLADEGVLFKTAIAPGTWTLPSHASLFTGMYPSKHGAHNKHQFLNERHTTLAEFLLSKGYQTACFSNNPFVSQKDGIGRGFEEFHELWRTSGLRGSWSKAQKAVIKLTGRHDKGARALTCTIIHWLEKRLPERPFLIFANYLEAHLDYAPPKPYDTMFLPKGVSRIRAHRVNQDPVAFIGRKVSMSQEDFNILYSLYDGEIAYQDRWLRVLFDHLRQQSLINDTILIVTSDHGDNIGEHQLMGHEFSLSEQLLHIPLIIRYPKVYEGGLRVDGITQLTDIFPTIVDIIDGNQDVKRPKQGFSLIPSRFTELRDRIAYAELFAPNQQNISDRYAGIDLSQFLKDRRVVWTRDYKFIWSSKCDHELFDLRYDAAEENNIYSDMPEKAAEMQGILDSWLNSFDHEADFQQDFETDEKTVERLRELGYID